MLVDETDGRFRYFIIDTGFWFSVESIAPGWFGSHDYDDKHVYAERLTKEQVQDLPEFSEDLSTMIMKSSQRSLSSVSGNINSSPLYNADPYDYDQEPYFYNDQNLRLYEERLRGKRNRRADIL